MSEQTLRILAKKYDAGNLFGYLTYPLVAQWKDRIAPDDVLRLCRQSMDERRAAGAYLYFHFPYCRVLCTYCSCYMQVASSPEAQYDAYLDGMEAELELKLGDIGGPIRVSDMHWGGGTPSLMTPRQIERIFRRIDDLVEWTGSGELSIEAYPDRQLLTDEKLQLIKDVGFTRISFGIEELDPKVLRAINRQQTLDDLEELFTRAREIGLKVHTDIVYGLPYQTLDTLGKTLAAVVALAPERLDTFSFLYTPSIVPHQAAIRPATLPDSYERVKLYQLLDRTMTESGYHRIGVDHYTLEPEDPLTRAAQDGTLVYNVQGYEPQGRGSFLGFGSSAMSFVGSSYFQSSHSVADYLGTLAQGALPIIENRACQLTDDDRIRHRVILGDLFCQLAIDKPALRTAYAIDFDAYFADALPGLREMERDGLVSGVDSERVQVTDLGRPFFRRICVLFDAFAAAVARLRVIA